MTDIPAAGQSWHPVHTLVSWPAVIAGALVAVSVGAMLNFLGAALGAASVDLYALGRGEAEDFTAAAGLWMAIANAAALFVGAAVASRAAKFSDHHRGALQGLSVWAVAFTLAVVIGSVTAAQSAATAADAVADEAVDARLDNATVVVTDPRTGEAVLTPAPSAEATAEDVADTTATAALWAFLTMLLGAVAAVLGGFYGARRHRWLAKAGVTEGAADTLPPRV